MKILIGLAIACAVLAGAGCSYHETVVEKPATTTAYVVTETPPPPPPATVVVPSD